MLSLTAFADELEREKARQRTADAMWRKARAGHVTGGPCLATTTCAWTVTLSATSAASRLNHVRNECQEIADWRDLVFAPRDYDVALELKQLDRVRIRTMRLALIELSELLAHASDRVGAALTFDFLPDNTPDVFDADVLLEYLKRAR